MAALGRQRTNKVDVYVGEGAVRYRCANNTRGANSGRDTSNIPVVSNLKFQRRVLEFLNDLLGLGTEQE